MDQKDNNNRSNMLNPNNPAYWKCRGYPQRPDNWEEKKIYSSATELIIQSGNVCGTCKCLSSKKDASCQYENPMNENNNA